MNYSDLRPILFKLPPETAHNLAEFAMRSLEVAAPSALGFLANKYAYYGEVLSGAEFRTTLSQQIFGRVFPTPIGVAAGFDKNAVMIRPLAALGFGFIEVGTMTPKSQKGNPKPRLWRHVAQNSLQNAMGFNNDGAAKIAKRLEKIAPFALPIGANLGKNKTTPNENAIADYEKCLIAAQDHADYIAFNLSSPNTPNLRALQSAEFARELFAMARSRTAKPLALKIAPDLEIAEALAISAAAIESGATALIVANTTNDYSLIADSGKNGGGLSGGVLTEKSREFFARVAREFFGKAVLISSGGIMSAEEAFLRVKLGASLAQCYTGFIYGGFGFAAGISRGVENLMRQEGFGAIGEAVGAAIK
ncbi:MAG: dihydroorotate dehydrogenase (quinone) [Helicobacteraceae bacterium]|jgi:dihydroorotate dehydrogenase|nr:dihydroorotate dehydrogenase (quinone) [Helicobacteraceae bacterium]